MADGSFQPSSMKLRLYLRVPVPAHRKALTRILLSSHSLGIELLRYQDDHFRLTDIFMTLPTIPRRWPSMDDFIRHLVQTRNFKFDIIQRLAKYTYDVLAHYSTTPLFRPAGYTYSALG
ncbi:hypothetical protein DFH08DRAFT_982794 [Mycena albidolilacea]|uniref:Uncharacterized protein n=1 Tax=Mycena albidolilacea TaxID=1033008 RepID=A0AAD7F6Z3_9AGAR|nr:hypothetical protein DFH08DRAFT_982794 [Mycena albidolilacea]